MMDVNEHEPVFDPDELEEPEFEEDAKAGTDGETVITDGLRELVLLRATVLQAQAAALDSMEKALQRSTRKGREALGDQVSRVREAAELLNAVMP